MPVKIAALQFLKKAGASGRFFISSKLLATKTRRHKGNVIDYVFYNKTA